MAYKIVKRKTKHGIQVSIVLHKDSKSSFVKTVGTAKDEFQLNTLLLEAYSKIDSLEGNLWSTLNTNQDLKPIKLEGYKVEKMICRKLYSELSKHFDFVISNPVNPLFRDLCILRITDPKSKKESVELLKDLFDLDYSLDQIYYLKTLMKDSKDLITTQVVRSLSQNMFSLVFYDVTTVYFESFTEDDLRKCGFSKDNKFNQPQLIIGLLVNIQGIPLDYELYEGNTFEGHTFIPSIKHFVDKYSIKDLTVVADAAMMSKVTFKELEDSNLKYVIGARLANLESSILQSINTNFIKSENNTIRIKKLVVHYSLTRARKDRSDRLKQIERAEKRLSKPTNKSVKFLKKLSKDEYVMNTELITKSEQLEGLKGYYTNLELSDLEIVSIYSNLWKIEHNFRITKTDLALRPIFHFKEEGIKFHLLICFVALAISRKIEIEYKCSIKRYVQGLIKEREVTFKNLSTNQSYII